MGGRVESASGLAPGQEQRRKQQQDGEEEECLCERRGDVMHLMLLYSVPSLPASDGIQPQCVGGSYPPEVESE